MSSTWSLVIPLAFGAAISPTLLTIELLILAGAKERVPRAWAMALGCATFLLLYMTVLTTIARNVDLVSEHQSAVERGVKIVAAVLLLLLGLRAIKERHRPPKRHSEKLRDGGLVLYFLIGLGGMATNFSSLVLVLPATHIAVTSSAPPDQQGAMLGFIFLVTLLPVILPVGAATLFGKKANPVLEKMNNFSTKYNPEIRAGICFFFTVLLLLSAWK